jgi:hypothetical protein
MKKSFIACCLLMTAMTHTATARIWRVNNDLTRDPDFATISAAVTAAAPGDTIHVEPSATAYANFILNKPLVILGNGYFLNASNLQANTDSSVVAGLSIDSTSITANGSGSVIAGIVFSGSLSLLHNVRNITITRCQLANQFNIVAYDRAAGGISVTKCFLQSFVTESNITAAVNITFENNIFSAATGVSGSTINLGANFSGLFRNNVINQLAGATTLNNFYIANNVFSNAGLTAVNGSNNIIRNNSFAAATVTNVINGVDGNQTNVAMAPLFTGNLATGYGDARFQTVAASSLRGTGETIGGITPDRGAYNTVTATDTNRTSGIPAIPTIYSLTVPISIPPTAVTMDITVSTRSNN